jgi:hypothetical protein
MRIKLIALATVVAALAVGVVTSQAALQQKVSVNVNIPKPGAAGTVKVSLKNDDPGKVPERIKTIVVTSKSVKWNSKAVPYCNVKIPTNADGDNNAAKLTCPSKSKVGSGKFLVNTGIPGQAPPAELYVIDGNVTVYNYKPRPGNVAGFLVEIQSDVPVPNAHQYQYVGITRAGVMTAEIPNTADLPPQVRDILLNLPGRQISLNSLDLTLKAPKVKKGKKPLFTITNFKKLDVSGELIRE